MALPLFIHCWLIVEIVLIAVRVSFGMVLVCDLSCTEHNNNKNDTTTRDDAGVGPASRNNMTGMHNGKNCDDHGVTHTNDFWNAEAYDVKNITLFLI